MNQTTSLPRKTPTALLIVFWLYVGIPLVIGVTQTLIKAGALFK